MAKVIAGIGTGIQGTIDELSFYRMKGVDKTIVRRKGGHTKAKVKRMPRVKRVLAEFSGRSKASKCLRTALGTVIGLADRNLAGTFNALILPVQEMDIKHRVGERNIHLSAYPQILKGYSLNKTHLFDSVVRFPLQWSLDRETGTATVHIPALVAGLNLVSPESHPWYSFVVSLGLVPDLNWHPSRYFPATKNENHGAYEATSDWFPLQEGSPALDLTVTYPKLPKVRQYTLVLAVGIRYGIQKGVQHISQAPNAGSAKILELL